MIDFVNCNSNYRMIGHHDYRVSEETMLNQLNDSIESGLIPNHELGIFIKDNYGALVGFCPDNCSSIEDLVEFTLLDFNRRFVGKLTIKEKLREIRNGVDFSFDPYFGYHKLIQEGYDLVIGPGCNVYGEHWNKAVYCRNYKEILGNNRRKII